MTSASSNEGGPPAAGGAGVADPWRVLGIHPTADDEELRATYLQRVREHPPDRDPEAFERIRDAYDLLRDPLRRTAEMLDAVDPQAPLEELLGELSPRRFVGPEPWLRALKEG